MANPSLKHETQRFRQLRKLNLVHDFGLIGSFVNKLICTIKVSYQCNQGIRNFFKFLCSNDYETIADGMNH